MAGWPPRPRCRIREVRRGCVGRLSGGRQPRGGLWITRQILWITLDSGLAACGQRSTEREDTVTIRDHEPHRTAPSHAAARPQPALAGPAHPPTRRRPGAAPCCWSWPTPAPPDLLDLLDGTRSERAVLTQAAAAQVTADDARTLLDALRDAGLLVPAHSLLPRDLAGPVRARLAAEAGALALAAARLPGTPAQVLRRRRARPGRAHRRRGARRAAGGGAGPGRRRAGDPPPHRPGPPRRPGRHGHPRHRAGSAAGTGACGRRSTASRRAPAPTRAGRAGSTW